MKDIVNIIGICIIAVVLSILTYMFAPPAWGVGSINNDFGDPIRYVATLKAKDSVGISFTYIERSMEKFSTFLCEVEEPTGSIGVAQIKLQDGNGKEYSTQWDFIKYDPRTKKDHYVISLKEADLLRKLIRNNTSLKIVFIDSNGSKVLKRIQCNGFDKICKRAKKRGNR